MVHYGGTDERKQSVGESRGVFTFRIPSPFWFPSFFFIFLTERATSTVKKIKGMNNKLPLKVSNKTFYYKIYVYRTIKYIFEKKKMFTTVHPQIEARIMN